MRSFKLSHSLSQFVYLSLLAAYFAFESCHEALILEVLVSDSTSSRSHRKSLHKCISIGHFFLQLRNMIFNLGGLTDQSLFIAFDGLESTQQEFRVILVGEVR